MKRGITFLLTICLASMSMVRSEQQPPKPLPQVDDFIREMKRTLLKANEAAGNYVYRVKASGSGMGMSTQEEFEVYHFKRCEQCSDETNFNAVQYYIYPFKNHTFERLIRGDPPSDQREVAGANDSGIKIDLMKEAKNQRNLSEDQEKRLAEEEIDEIFSLYHPRILRREFLDGHPALVLEFIPRRGIKTKRTLTNFIKHLEAKVWVEEDEHEIMRIETVAIEDITFAGPLAKIEKGARYIERRQKVNNEVWLPSRTESNYKFKLMFMGFKIRELEEYYGYRKFSVGTKITFDP